MNSLAAASVDPGTAFTLLQETFERLVCTDAAGYHEFSFSMAGREVLLRMLGQALATDIVRPFAHLSALHEARRKPDLTIHVWDEAASGALLPTEWQHDLDARGRVTSSADGEILVYERSDTLTVLNRRSGQVFGCVRAASRPLSERARPFNFALTVWCRDNQVHLVHGGLIADGRGALVAGLSGTGKSTATLACAVAGYEFLGDDAVALTGGADGDFHGHSVYGSVTLDADGLARFPGLDAGIAPRQPSDEKRLVFLGDCPPIRLGRSAPIRVVVLARIASEARSVFWPATKSEALLRLAPSSLIKRAVDTRDCLQQMARLIDRVPSYWLTLGSDPRTIPDQVARMLREVGA